MTETVNYRFTVKETADGAPWIACEPLEKNLSIVGKGMLGLKLRDGSTIDEAAEIARLLNREVSAVCYTR